MEIIKIANFIGGEFQSCPRELESVNPATGAKNATIPDSGKEEVDAAVAAAKAAFPAWSALSCDARAQHLLKVADLLEEKIMEFAEAESRDQGKPIWLSKALDIPRAVYNLRHFAQTVPHLLTTSKMLPSSNTLNYTVREPIGVAGLISPWNLPLYLLTFKIAPAVMCGNTVVAKPSELTSVTAYMLCKILVQAKMPPGVINMVFGDGARAGSCLTTHRDVPLVSFTGSTATGARIAVAAAPLFKKLSLEMGGKNPAIVYSDCDMEDTISTLIRSSFINQGQVCLCTSRIFVHKDIYDRFLQAFVAAARSQKVGDPFTPGVFLGALNSAPHLTKVQGCVKKAVQQGGKVMCGYTVDDLKIEPQNVNGSFMAPTVITGMADTAECMTEEIFGPVTCVTKFSTDEEALERANNTPYGLCAAVFTKDLSRAHRAAQELKAGTVWTNCWLVRDLDMPFGGFKQSSLGREGTHDSWNFFTQQKTVCIKI